MKKVDNTPKTKYPTGFTILIITYLYMANNAHQRVDYVILRLAQCNSGHGCVVFHPLDARVRSFSLTVNILILSPLIDIYLDFYRL